MNVLIIVGSLLIFMNIIFIEAATIYIDKMDIDFSTANNIEVCKNNKDCKFEYFYSITDRYIVCPKGWIGKVYKDDNGRYKVVSYRIQSSKLKGQPFEENCKKTNPVKIPNYMRPTVSSSAKTVFRKTTPHMLRQASLGINDISSIMTADYTDSFQDDLSFKTAYQDSSILENSQIIPNHSSTKSFPANMVDGSDDVVWGFFVFILSSVSAIVSFLLRKAMKKQQKVKETKSVLPVDSTSSVQSIITSNPRYMPQIVIPQASTPQSNIQTQPPSYHPSFQASVIPPHVPQTSEQLSHLTNIPSQYVASTLQSTDMPHSNYPSLQASSNHAWAPQATAPISDLVDRRPQQQASISQSTFVSQPSSYYPNFSASVTPSYDTIITNMANLPANFRGCSCEVGNCISGNCNCHKYNVPCTRLCHKNSYNANCKRTPDQCCQ